MCCYDFFMSHNKNLKFFKYNKQTNNKQQRTTTNKRQQQTTKKTLISLTSKIMSISHGNMMRPVEWTDEPHRMRVVEPEDEDSWKVLWKSTYWLGLIPNADDQLDECLDWIEEASEEYDFVEESWRICSLPEERGVCYSPQVIWTDGCPHVWDSVHSVYVPMNEDYRGMFPLPKQYTECHIDEIVGELQEVHKPIDVVSEMDWADQEMPKDSFPYLPEKFFREIISDNKPITDNQARFLVWMNDQRERILVTQFPQDEVCSNDGKYFIEGTSEEKIWRGSICGNPDSIIKRSYSEWIAMFTPRNSFANMVNAGMNIDRDLGRPSALSHPLGLVQNITIESAKITSIIYGKNDEINFCICDTQDGYSAYVSSKLMTDTEKCMFSTYAHHIGDTLHIKCKSVKGHNNKWRAYQIVADNQIELKISAPKCEGNWGWLIGKNGSTLKNIAEHASQHDSLTPQLYLKSEDDSTAIITINISRHQVMFDIKQIHLEIRHQFYRYFRHGDALEITMIE